MKGDDYKPWLQHEPVRRKAPKQESAPPPNWPLRITVFVILVIVFLFLLDVLGGNLSDQHFTPPTNNNKVSHL